MFLLGNLKIIEVAVLKVQQLVNNKWKVYEKHEKLLIGDK